MYSKSDWRRYLCYRGGLWYGTVNDLQEHRRSNLCIFEPIPNVKYHKFTRTGHQPDAILQENNILVESGHRRPVSRWNPTYSPLSYVASDKPDPPILSQPQQSCRRCRQRFASGTRGAVFGGYGEEAVVRDNGLVAIEEGAECGAVR